jgi:quercetin dioxygenase-like cupin family protein
MQKHIRVLMFVSTLACLMATVLLPAAMPAASQKANGVEIKDEPHHHLKFENEFVRVWETVLPAGEATLWHRHDFDNVAVTITDAKLRVEPFGGSPVESETKMGDVGFRGAAYVHRAISSGATTYHNLLIELLKSPGKPKNLPPLKNESERKPVFENDRLRVYRVSLAPGESLAMHTHPYAGLGLVLTNAEVAFETVGSKQIQRAKVAVGEVRWRPGPVTHSIRNVGKTRFEGVDIELK